MSDLLLKWINRNLHKGYRSCSDIWRNQALTALDNLYVTFAVLAKAILDGDQNDIVGFGVIELVHGELNSIHQPDDPFIVPRSTRLQTSLRTIHLHDGNLGIYFVDPLESAPYSRHSPEDQEMDRGALRLFSHTTFNILTKKFSVNAFKLPPWAGMIGNRQDSAPQIFPASFWRDQMLVPVYGKGGGSEFRPPGATNYLLASFDKLESKSKHSTTLKAFRF